MPVKVPALRGSGVGVKIEKPYRISMKGCGHSKATPFFNVNNMMCPGTERLSKFQFNWLLSYSIRTLKLKCPTQYYALNFKT